MIPQTYEDWLYCITKKCSIRLTPDYINQRLDVLNSKNNKETMRMTELYGEAHIENLKHWFRQALSMF